MQKSSIPMLTQADLDEYNRGLVSERLQEVWGFTLDELKSIIGSGGYVALESETKPATRS